MDATEINILKLANKKHEFEFKIDSGFFENFDPEILKEGNLQTKLIIDKNDAMITALFDIQGTVKLICDRSLEKFDHPVRESKQLIYKYADEYEEISDDLINIPQNTEKLDFTQHIYDFIVLSLPMRKIHPKFAGSEDEEFIYRTEEEESEENTEETNDPRWEALKKLKFKN